MKLAWGVGICALGLLLAALGGRRPKLRALGMSLTLGGFFLAWTAALPAPWKQTSPETGVALLLSAVALFRVMAGFEKGR